MQPKPHRTIIALKEWDELVIDTYGKPYSFQQQDGCKPKGTFWLSIPKLASDYEHTSLPEEINGYRKGVSFATWLDRHPKAWNGKAADELYIDLFWNRNFYPNVQMIANDLYEKGLIEAGEYVIKIDW